MTVGTAFAVPLLALGVWRPVVALPVLLVAVAVGLRCARAVPPVDAPAWTTRGLVAICLAAGVWAGATHAEHVVLRRDAGTYALYGQQIATDHGLPVDADVAELGGAAVLNLPGVTVASPGFFAQGSGAGTHVVPQFLPAIPVLLSVGSWTAGWTGLLLVPAVVLTLGLLAFGALARRLVGPGWAVLATGVLALTQPVLHAGRSTYSEPVALLVGCAAMTVVVAAVQGRVRWLGLLGGLLVGGAGLVRVDALRESALLLPAIALLAWRRSPVARPLLSGLVIGTVVSALAALLLSRPYLGAVAGSLLPLLAATVALGGGSLLALRLARSGRRLPLGVARRSPALLAGAVLLGFVVLASRPLWLVVRQSAADSGARVVAGLQLAQGLTVDGGRTYDEATVGWTAWWVGVPALLLALAAAAHLASRLAAAVRDGRRLPAWSAPALVGAASTALTLYRPGITPDHPWADRRLVPVVLPAVVLLAVAALAFLLREAAPVLARADPAPRPGDHAIWGHASRGHESRGHGSRGHELHDHGGGGCGVHDHGGGWAMNAVAAVGAALLLVPAAVGTLPVATQRTERGEVGAVAAACAALRPGDTAVLVDSRAANEWTQVLRGVCGTPAVVVRPLRVNGVSTPDAGTVAAVSAAVTAAGRRPVVVAAESAQSLTALGVTPAQVVSLSTTEDQRLLTRRPTGSAALRIDLWLGPVSSAGP